MLELLLVKGEDIVKIYFCPIKNKSLSIGNKWLDWHSICGSVLTERNSYFMII